MRRQREREERGGREGAKGERNIVKGALIKTISNVGYRDREGQKQRVQPASTMKENQGEPPLL